MKINPLSDIHLEFGKFDFPNTDADVVVLAGDISVGLDQLAFVREWVMSNPNKMFIYITGNHEYYHHDVAEHDTDVKAFLADLPNIRFLDNDWIKIGDVVFVGGTLWTDFNRGNPMEMGRAMGGMNDYHQIRDGVGKFVPGEALVKHRRTRKVIESVLKAQHNKVVVVTHHAPCELSVPAKFKGNKMNSCYYSDLTGIIFEYQPVLWIHGHIHSNSDYVIDKTRVVCNPRGYAGYELNEDFNPNLIIEI